MSATPDRSPDKCPALSKLIHKPALWLALVTSAFIVLCIVYNYSLPVFEGFDETSHYRVVDDYARHWTLPDLERAPSHEAQQPPLYYATGALLIAPIDRSDFDRVFQVNPQAAVNVRQNRAPTDLSLVPQGTTLAVRVLRLFSTLWGAALVLLTYALARQLKLSVAAALLSAALLAFNPKFILLSASVSNDIATICLAALSLILCTRIMSRAPSMAQAFVLGASVGLAALSKYSGLALGLPAAFALAWSVHRHTNGRATWRALLKYEGMLAAGAFLVCGWLFVLQWTRYGNPLAWEQVRALNLFSLRDSPLSLPQLAATLPSLLPTLWRISTDAIAQRTGDTIALVTLGLAIVGWAMGIRRRQLPATLWLLPIAIAASVIALLPWMQSYGGTEDSRLLPMLFSGSAILVASGLTAFRPISAGRWMTLGVTAAAGLWAAITPIAVIAPLYPPQEPLRDDQYVWQVTPAEADALPTTPVASFENGIQLASVTLHNSHLAQGEPIVMTGVWRVTGPVMDTYELTVEAFDTQNKSVGKIDLQPLEGRRPTHLWQVGDTFRDEFTIPLNTLSGNIPKIITLYVSWHDAAPPYNKVKVTGSDAVSAPVGQVKLLAAHAQIAKPQYPTDALFGYVIRLEGYDLQGDQLVLYWRALGQVPADYQVFVHALDAQGKLSAQSDDPIPMPAALWDNEELVLDARTIPGLAGADTVTVGLYDQVSGTRMTAKHRDGSDWPDNSVTLWQGHTP